MDCRNSGKHRHKLNLSEEEVVSLIARAKEKMLAARRLRRPTPAVDDTLYVAWNSMFVSAYLEAARVLGRPDCRAFALKTLDRILAEAWDPAKGFCIAWAARAWKARSTIRCSPLPRCSMPGNRRSTGAISKSPSAPRSFASSAIGDPEGGGFFDRAKDAAPMGGLEVRRKPLQDSPTPAGNSVAAIVLDRLYGFTGEKSIASGRKKRSRLL